jgi:hypothetical protein
MKRLSQLSPLFQLATLCVYTQLVPAEVGDDSGIIGAAAMAKREQTGEI